MEFLTSEVNPLRSNVGLEPASSSTVALGLDNDVLSGLSAKLPVMGGSESPVVDSVSIGSTADSNSIMGRDPVGDAIAPNNTPPFPADVDPLTGETKNLTPVPLVAGVDLAGQYFNVVPTSAQAGNSVNLQYRIQNLGSSVARGSTVKFYLSTDRTIGVGDYELGSASVVSLGSGGNTGLLNKTVTIPGVGNAFWKSVGDGNYYIGMKVDANNQIAESNENNNASTGFFKDYDSLRVGGTKVADLSGKYFDVVQEPLRAGNSFSVNYQIQNTGVGTAAASTTNFYLSKDNVINTSDYFLGSAYTGSLASNTSTATLTQYLTLPGAGNPFWSGGDGTYHIGMITDGNNNVSETNEVNNASTGEFKDYDSLLINYTKLNQIKVNINRVAQIDNLDPDPIFFTNRADFYSKVTIAGVTQSSPTIDGKDDVSPNWEFIQVAAGPVPIKVELWESDLGSGDEHVDINSRAGYKDLNLTYDPITGAIYGDTYGSRGQQIYSYGAGDSDRGKIWFTIDHV
jgi:CARDB